MFTTYITYTACSWCHCWDFNNQFYSCCIDLFISTHWSDYMEIQFSTTKETEQNCTGIGFGTNLVLKYKFWPS